MMGTYEKTFFAGWVYASGAVRGRHGHHHLAARRVLHALRRVTHLPGRLLS